MQATLTVERVTKSRLPDVDLDNLPFGKTFTDHMFIIDYKDGKWQEGKIMPFQHLSLHPATSALHYGQSFFEGMKAELGPDGMPLLFRPEMNLRRMNKTAKRLAMPSLDENDFLDWLKELLRIEKDWIPTSEGSSLYIRPIMFATDEHIGVKIATNYRFMIMCCSVGPYYADPVKVYIEDKYIRAAPGGTGDAKAAGNYAPSLMPTKLAKDAGYDQVLWTSVNDHKYVQEIGTMNVFFIIDGVVVTPNKDGNILEGITRDSIIQLCRDEGLTVEERPVSVAELWEAHKAGKLNDCFGAGTAVAVIPIKSLGNKDGVMELPSLEERTWSPKIKEKLIAIKRGLTADPYNWTQKV